MGILTPCRYVFQALLADTKQWLWLAWLQRKMKPAHCMTTLFAYLVSFSVALMANGTNRFREPQETKYKACW